LQNRETAGGSKEGGYDRGRESAVLRHFRELTVEQPDELGLVQAVDELPHQCSQAGRCVGNSASVTGHIRQQQTRDPSGGATRCVIDVTAVPRFAERLAVDPGVETAEFDSALSQLASAPDFHALHVL
jgi:hypothetical protein